MVRADAVAAVFSRHREAQFVGIRQGAYRRPRPQEGRGGRAGGSSDIGGHGGVSAVQPGVRHQLGWRVCAVGGDPETEKH